MFSRAHLLACWLALIVAPLRAQVLPAEVEAALARARVPREAFSVMVVSAPGGTPARLSHRSQVPVNPASVMKLVTTYAALDLLGPTYTWTTPVFVEGSVREGTLQGNLYIKGQGDPKLVVERLWLLLRRVQGLGIRAVSGDIVLDHSAFENLAQDPAEFDGEPLRPYNAAPDALLLNFKSVVMTFVPDPVAKVAHVHFEPQLAGVQMQGSVGLSSGDCGDYRAALKADFVDPARVRFGGSYPLSCGEKVWPVAYADPTSYAARAVEGLWRDMGGKLTGKVREGRVPAGLSPSFEFSSPALAEIVRDINKYSNNVMAQQLFLTLGLQAAARKDPSTAQGTLAQAREVLRTWWSERLARGDDTASAGGNAVDLPVLDNGSGLSRTSRISAQALASLLQAAYRSNLMSELMASLPVSGVDGTLRRSKSRVPGGAHLKTGTLRDVSAVAGYVDGASGQRYVMVAVANHANASAMRPVFDALIDWTARDQ